MPYDAITIDTSTVQQHGLKLESGLLATLQQFKDGPTKLVMTEIVINEICGHIAKNAIQARDSAITALNKASENALLDNHGSAIKTALTQALGDPVEVARRRVDAFIADCGIEVISSELVNTKDLVDLYFSKSPPFDPTGPKAHEFKDAIALMSVKRWAEFKQWSVLAVSGDDGWVAFGEQEENINVEKSLTKALGTVQTQATEARASIYSFLKAFENESDIDPVKHIKDTIHDMVMDWSFDVEAHSSFYYESDDTYLTLEDIVPVRDAGGKLMFTIVRLGKDMATFQARINVRATAHSSFSLDLWDGVDREYVGMGSVSRTVDVDGNCDMLVTVYGDLDGDLADLEITEIELTQGISSADFGEIEMDHDDYHYDQEDP